MTFSENPRAVVGDNRSPDYAQRITEQMAEEYGALNESVAALLEEARGKPVDVNDDDTATDIGALIKRLSDADKRAEAFRVAEGEPHLRAKNAVDQFFFAIRDKLARRNKNDRSAKPGAADILQARVTAYLERKRIEEEARRKAEAARLWREAEDKRLAEEAALREAEEKRLAAERARKPEIVEQKEAVAAQAEQAASTAVAEAAVASSLAQEAHIATLAKAADMARTRGDDGVLLTLANENYAILLDRSKITPEDALKLWPFFTDAEVEKALRGWAKTTGYRQPMTGTEIGKKNKGVTR
jgi:hypothetical protein